MLNCVAIRSFGPSALNCARVGPSTENQTRLVLDTLDKHDCPNNLFMLNYWPVMGIVNVVYISKRTIGDAKTAYLLVYLIIDSESLVQLSKTTLLLKFKMPSVCLSVFFTPVFISAS